jgi:hypothetical protein
LKHYKILTQALTVVFLIPILGFFPSVWRSKADKALRRPAETSWWGTRSSPTSWGLGTVRRSGGGEKESTQYFFCPHYPCSSARFACLGEQQSEYNCVFPQKFCNQPDDQLYLLSVDYKKHSPDFGNLQQMR